VTDNRVLRERCSSNLRRDAQYGCQRCLK
jgi:hypothetical protein